MRESRHNLQKNQGLYIRITPEENKIIQDLRKNYAVNVSQLVRKSIQDHYRQVKR
jgi:hypothetical protein